MKPTVFIILIMIIIVTLIVTLNYSYLDDSVTGFFQNQIETFGYIGIILTVFILELIPQPFFSALIPFTTGLLFGLNFYTLLIIIIISSISANYLAYVIGFYSSESIAKLLISKKNYNKSLILFEKHGKKVITILALTPLPYLPIIGGLFKMTLTDFTKYAIIPRILHFLVFSFLISYFLTSHALL